MKNLFTPWRWAYLKESESRPEEECFFCAAVREPDDPQRLVVHRQGGYLVVLNRHPYTNGHLMIAPLEHLASPEEATEARQGEIWPLVIRSLRVLRKAYRPDGFNLGMNLGTVAGAGVPGHFHLHVVPRWTGDTNFMSVVAGVRLVPEELHTTWSRLRQLFAEEG